MLTLSVSSTLKDLRLTVGWHEPATSPWRKVLLIDVPKSLTSWYLPVSYDSRLQNAHSTAWEVSKSNDHMSLAQI